MKVRKCVRLTCAAAVKSKKWLSKLFLNTMKRRKESVATVCRRTTKFLTFNTANLLKKTMANTKKYRFLEKAMEEYERSGHIYQSKQYVDTDSDDDDDLGRELDYYLGVRNKETYWRDLEGEEQIRKDYYINHFGVTEDDYNQYYKKTYFKKPSHTVTPRLKQVPFKIHKKRSRKNSNFKREGSNFWCEKTGILKMFLSNRKDSEYSSSDSYSECDTSPRDNELKDNFDFLTNNFKRFTDLDNLNLDGGSGEVSQL